MNLEKPKSSEAGSEEFNHFETDRNLVNWIKKLKKMAFKDQVKEWEKYKKWNAEQEAQRRERAKITQDKIDKMTDEEYREHVQSLKIPQTDYKERKSAKELVEFAEAWEQFNIFKNNMERRESPDRPPTELDILQDKERAKEQRLRMGKKRRLRKLLDGLGAELDDL